MKRTRIVATIGPVTANKDSLLDLKNAGMNMVRLNGSHNSLKWHKEIISLVQSVLPDIPILLDIPGRKIRTIQLEYEPEFKSGDVINLTTDTSYNGKEKVPVNYSLLHQDLSPGQIVLADDGTLRFTIQKIEGMDIFLKAETDGKLKSKKGINVPYVKLNTRLVTERDIEMISFAQENKVDFIGISFVESSAHIQAIKEIIGNHSYPKIVSKIENQGGLNNMKEIIESTDAIMIDRGDLSVETELSTVALRQKEIIIESNKSAKPVIVATELLHTMIYNNFPTKAEVSDITNAVLDGCAAVMLSGETAVGKFPIESVKIMNEVITKAENFLEINNLAKKETPLKKNISYAIADAIELLCYESVITKVIAVTRSGYAAQRLSVKNIKQQIIAVSDDINSSKSFNLYPRVTGVYYPEKFFKQSSDHIINVVKFLYEKKFLYYEDTVLVTAVNYPNSGNRMNSIQTLNIIDMIKIFNW